MPKEPTSHNSSAALFPPGDVSYDGQGWVPEVSQITSSPMKYSEQTSNQPTAHRFPRQNGFNLTDNAHQNPYGQDYSDNDHSHNHFADKVQSMNSDKNNESASTLFKRGNLHDEIGDNSAFGGSMISDQKTWVQGEYNQKWTVSSIKIKPFKKKFMYGGVGNNP